MAIRINNNVASLKGVRYLNQTDKRLTDSLEKISSGMRINRGGDSPAGLMISEQMRSQIASVNQAVSNTELATAMVQTSEGSLGEINNLLVRMRQLALHAANEGANDPRAMEADQLEIKNSIDSIQRIAETARFGDKKLLDGSTGVSGVALGKGLVYLGATGNTGTSPVEGYVVNVTGLPTKASLHGAKAITPDITSGLSITLIEGGRTLQITGKPGESSQSFIGRLTEEAQRLGLDLEITAGEDNILHVEHKRYGSAYGFQAASSVAGVLGEKENVAQEAAKGADIKGTLNGESAIGKGQSLTGASGNKHTEGLSVRYVGELVEKPGTAAGQPAQYERKMALGAAGSVNIKNNSVGFQTGPNPGDTTEVLLPNVSPSQLGLNVENESEIKSLAELNVNSTQGAQDSLSVIDRAIEETSQARGRLGAFQRNNLEVNMAAMRVTAENLTAAESVIRDTDLAKEVAEFTKQRIQLEANAAVLAHANAAPSRVIRLLD